MPKTQIDRDKLSKAIRKMDNKTVRFLLDDAIDMLPKTKLKTLVEGYFDLSDLRPDRRRKRALLADVKEFQRASLNNEYYESFNVNSRNFMDISGGTEAWIDECNRLLDRCVAQSDKGYSAETRDAFEIIFSLLEHIDECFDDIIFFADEAGSWQVGVTWKEVFPAWFKCLSPITDPEEYASKIVRTVDHFDENNRTKHLRAARRVATPAQKRALRGA